MTDNMNTADLVKRLRAIDHENLEDCFLQSPYFSKAADRIEQLEAALTRANAATAAAYEAMASEFDSLGNVGLVVATGIRALATPDQTAALDRLIAEAVGPYADAMRYYETQFCEGFCEDMPDRSVTNEGMENDCGGCKARAILAASKKGGAA